MRDLTKRLAFRGTAHFSRKRFVEALLQTNQPSGEAFEHFRFTIAESDGVEQLVESHRALFLQRAGVGQVLLADADGVDDHEAVLALDAGIDLLHLGFGNHPHAPALHLLEVTARSDRAHEENDLQRLNVRAGGDHVDGDGDARVVAVAEGLENLVRREVRDFFPDDFLDLFSIGSDFLLDIAHEPGAVSYLLAEVVAFVEDLAADAHDIVGVGVVLGEDQRLGHLVASGKDLREELVPKGLHHRADLVLGDHVAVELVGIVLEVVVELLPALLARLAVALVDVEAGVDLGALRGDLGLDAINVVVDVDAVGDRPFVVVLHHQILIEKAEGLLRRGRGKADQMGVEVFQHLAPEIVDRTVALVGDDDIESLDRECRVVFYRRSFLEERFQTLNRALVGFLIKLLSLEHRIEALDRADANLCGGVERIRGQALEDVLLVEFIVVVGRHILLKLFERLLAQVAAIDQKQHALGAGELDQSVAQDNREQRFAGAGGHLHERARPVVAQGLLDIHDRLRLGRPNVVDQRRHVLDAAKEVAFAGGVFGDRVDSLRRSVVFHPREQCFRTVKGEDVAAARHGIETVGEASLRPGGLVAERQRRAPGGNTERYALSRTSRTAPRHRSANGQPVWPLSCRSLWHRQTVCSPARRPLKESSRTATPRDAARLTALLSCTTQPQGVEQRVDLLSG